MANIFTQKPYDVKSKSKSNIFTKKPYETEKKDEVKEGFSSKDNGFSSAGTGAPEKPKQIITSKGGSSKSKAKTTTTSSTTTITPEKTPEQVSAEKVISAKLPLTRVERLKEEAKRVAPREALFVRIDDVPSRDVESRRVSPIFTRSSSGEFVESRQGISRESFADVKKAETVERLQVEEGFRDIERAKPKPKSRPEKFVEGVSNLVDFPVSKTKEFYLKSPESVKTVISPIPSFFLKPSQRDVLVTSSVDVGSYFIPYYGSTRFAKDVGVYGFRVSQKPSYAYEEGKFETLGLIGVGAISGGSKAYKYFKSDPLLSEFGSIKQSGQFIISRKTVSREASARFVSKGDDFVIGSDPLNVNQIVKASKVTTIRETPKTLVTEFKVKDSGLFVSRKGSRSLYLDVETGSTRIVDVFDVSRFGIKSSYTRVSKTSGDIINTQVFKLSSGKKVFDVSGVSDNFLIGLSKTGESFGFKSPYADSSRLVSFETASERSKVFSGTKEGGLLADISRTRSVDKITKLDKQYTVFFKEELGLVANKRGVSVKPISSSVEQKTILQFGKPAFVPNVRTLEGSRIVGVKYPQSVDIVKVSESLNIKFSQVYKPQAELITSTYFKGFGKYKVEGGLIFDTKNLLTRTAELNKISKEGLRAYKLQNRLSSNKEYGVLMEKYLKQYKSNKLTSKDYDDFRALSGLFGKEEQSIAFYNIKQKKYKLQEEYLNKYVSKNIEGIKSTPLDLFKSKKGSLRSISIVNLPKTERQVPKPEFVIIKSPPASVSKSFSPLAFSSYSSLPSSSFKPVFINTSKPDSSIVPKIKDRSSPFSSIKPSLVISPKRDVISVPSSQVIPKPDSSIKPDVFIKVKSRPVLQQQLKQESLLRQEAKLEQEVVPKVVTTTIPKLKTPFIKFPPIKFGGFAYANLPSSKSRFGQVSKFSFKPLESVNVPKRLDIFPSLQEVFRYEWTTGKESIMPKKTRKIREVFESQYFGRGNFGAIIPVEQERKKFKY